MSLDGWSIKKFVQEKLKEFDSYLLTIGKKVLILEKKMDILKEELCQVSKNAQSSQKEAKPTKTASATKVSSQKGKKVAKSKIKPHQSQQVR
tara:strand:+ start:648 stop:923 length:276 start_codon:yes stop_codon:yes gene_type:complete